MQAFQLSASIFQVAFLVVREAIEKPNATSNEIRYFILFILICLLFNDTNKIVKFTNAANEVAKVRPTTQIGRASCRERV